jgi:NADH:ubiquinone oxidoreductase subunit E
MLVDEERIEIVICMGSSCFARGNAQNLAMIQEFLASHDLKGSVQFSGKLCQDACKLGPNVTIAGETYDEVTAEKLRQILQQFGKPPAGA